MRFTSLLPLVLLLTTLLLPTATAAAEAPFFSEWNAEAGLDFVHFNGMSGELYFPEMTGQGGAFLDFDSDGDLDVYIVQGALIGPGMKLKDALFPPATPGPLQDRLYRNDLDPATGRVRLVDITEKSGLRASGYGMGVATGDVDNDGHIDLYVTNFGPNQLWRNRGDGTFENKTATVGGGGDQWSTSAAFFDYDRDGWLDLYVVNYVVYSVDNNITCYAPSSRRDYCGPAAFPPAADRLFHNRGDGTFEDVSIKTGLAAAPGPGLGVVSADFDGDGWVDIFVANDGQPNQLWINGRDGSFSDDALLAGAAVNRRGQAEASMGVDAADFDGDGDEDLFMTHLSGETNTLYINDGGGIFEDRSVETGLAAESLAYTAFGTGWLDIENDGWLDLLILNGAVKLQEELAQRGDLYPLDQPNQLFRNAAGRRFEEVSARGGSAFTRAEVSRGAAFGDLDNDGDTDILLLNNNGPARLLRNDAAEGTPWLGLRLVDKTGKRDLHGARAALDLEGAPPRWRRVRTDGSYCSAADPRLRFGLAGAPAAQRVRVIWPDGKEESWPAPPTGRYTTLRQGSGKPVRKP